MARVTPRSTDIVVRPKTPGTAIARRSTGVPGPVGYNKSIRKSVKVGGAAVGFGMAAGVGVHQYNKVKRKREGTRLHGKY